MLLKNPKEHNLNGLQIPDHSYKLIIIGGWGSGKTNSLFNQISHQANIDKIYLYAKDPSEAKYQLLIDTWESTSLKHCNDPKAFIEFPNYLDDIYKKNCRIQPK